VLGDECTELLERFFVELRAGNQDASSVGS